MTRIKICGLTNIEDALAAVELGADAIGFVLAESPRRVTPEVAASISEQLPPYIARVGVFVGGTIDSIETIFHTAKLTEAQIYSDHDSDLDLSIPYQRSFRVKDDNVLGQIRDLHLSRFHLDSFDPQRAGGTGQKFDWEIAVQAARLGQLTLAGGLNADNIGAALEQVQPYAVDLSSGVEKSPGHKDIGQMKTFISEVRRWDSRTS